MLPENQIPNAMGLNPSRSASMMGSMGGMMNDAMPITSEVPQQESELKKVALQFSSAWKQLEDLNGKFGGDAEKFRNAQKALENWFADIASKVPETATTPQNSY